LSICTRETSLPPPPGVIGFKDALALLLLATKRVNLVKNNDSQDPERVLNLEIDRISRGKGNVMYIMF
jgi:hypothetical protein